jgi:hypothetical protein
MISEGDFVLAQGDDETYVGIVQHVMTDGMFGIQYSDYSLMASTEEPAVLVRILEFEEGYGWDETERLVGVKGSLVTKIDPLTIPDLDGKFNTMTMKEFKMEENYESIDKAKKPNYADFIKPRSGGSDPSNPKLYARVVQAAKDKFDVYPSAVANSWVVQEYKRRGGTYKSNSVATKSVWDGSMFDTRGFNK